MNDISDKADIGKGVKFGSFCVIDADVEIGAECEIGHHVVILSGTKIGKRVRIDDHTSIGKMPMQASNSAVTRMADWAPCTIGDGVIIGSSVVIYIGSTIDADVLVADFAIIREDVSIGKRTIVGRGVAI